MLRVNSPGGVTTDYDLIVKFQHLLSMTQKGPPPGWKVGGNGGGGSAGGSSLPSGASFADPRIQQIYKTALNNFETAERAKANAKIQNLEAQKRQYEQELKDLLTQMNNEQRAKIHAALDEVRNNGRAWVDSVANPIKDGIDSTADWIIGQIESKIPSRAYEIPKLGEQLRGAKDSLKGAINGARSWLKLKIDWVKSQVQDAIWNFVEFLKNAYKTGGEINSSIELAAQDFNRKIEGLVGSINNWVGEFKGKILGSVEWLRNVGVDIPSIGFGQWKTPGFKWNFYESVVEPLANNLANGVKDQVNAVGNLARDALNWIKPRTQKAVAAIADAIFGDKTGHLWNQIHGVDAQIAATRTALEKAIVSEGQRILGIARQIEALLTNPEERKRVLDNLWKRGFKTIDEARIFVEQELPKISKQIKDELHKRTEQAKTIFSQLVRNVANRMTPGSTMNLSGELGIDISALIAKGKLTPGSTYEISRSLDGKTYSVTTKASVELAIEGGPNSPAGARVGVAGIAGQNLKVNFEPQATLGGGATVDVAIEHQFNEGSDDDMINLGLLVFKTLPTPGDLITDHLIEDLIGRNLSSIKPAIGGNLTGQVSIPGAEANFKEYMSFTPSGFKNGNRLTEVEVGLEIDGSLGFSDKLGIGLGGKATFSIENSSQKVEKISMKLETTVNPKFLGEFNKFVSDGKVVQRVEDAVSQFKIEGKAIIGVNLEVEIKDPGRLVPAGSSVIENIRELADSNSVSDFTGDAAKTLGSVISLIKEFRKSLTASLTLDSEQVYSVEAGGKIVVGGDLKLALGTKQSTLLWSNN